MKNNLHNTFGLAVATSVALAGCHQGPTGAQSPAAGMPSMAQSSIPERPTASEANLGVPSRDPDSATFSNTPSEASPRTYRVQGFSFGDGQSGGSNQFQQYIPQNQRSLVGTIPAGIKDLEIRLDSPEDVDVELWHGDKPIIAWPNGSLNGGRLASTNYNGVTVYWSGYDGDQTASGRGKEFIRLSGVTRNDFVVKVFGFRQGQAQVRYNWAGATSQVAACGSGTFNQAIPQGGLAYIGTIPAGVRDLHVQLTAPTDLDIQLWDGGDPIVRWPDGVLKGPAPAWTNHGGVRIDWSGFNGGQTYESRGNESIGISGTTRNEFVLLAYGFQQGAASVTYGWGGTCGGTGIGGGSSSGLAPEHQQRIEALAAKIGSVIGTPEGGIQQIGGGFQQTYRNASSPNPESAILYKADRGARWVHGAVYTKFKAAGGAQALGFPTTDEMTGMVSPLSGRKSQYQMFDGAGSPSIQWVSGIGTYILNETVRGEWLEGYNEAILGLPKGDLGSDAIQRFEGGLIRVNGKKAAWEPDLQNPIYRTMNVNPFPFRDGGLWCTRYAWGRAYEKLGAKLPVNRHARYWAEQARAAGLVVKNEPRANSIAVWEFGEQGHVAYIEEVHGNEITLTEANWAPGKTDAQYAGKAFWPVSETKATIAAHVHKAKDKLSFIYID